MFVLALSFFLAVSPSPSSQLEVARTEQPLALVLSGGVSLGAYEAGIAWTTIQYTRAANAPAGQDSFLLRPKMVTLTGASAGALNAFLAGTLWCESAGDASDASVDDNILRNSWLSVGADRLFPRNKAAYLPGDGLLSSRPVLDAFERVKQRIFVSGRRFRPGCELPIGITVTASEPRVEEVAGLQNLRQRYVVPFRLSVDDEGRMSMRPDPMASSAALRLPTREGSEELEPDQVMQALMASSAFPLAFQPRVVCECTASCPDENVMQADQCPGIWPGQTLPALSCPASDSKQAPMKLCGRAFVDGGLFDNAPLGLAIELAESRTRLPPLGSVSYSFVDPNLRKFTPWEAPNPKETNDLQGLVGTAKVILGAVEVSRNSELARATFQKQWNRTTADLLLEVSAAITQLSEIQQGFLTLDGLARKNVELGKVEPERLCRCFEQISPAPTLERLAECTRQPGPSRAAPVSLEPQRLVALARNVAGLITATARRVEQEGVPELTEDVAAEHLQPLRSAVELLAENVGLVASSDLPAPVLLSFKADLQRILASISPLSEATLVIFNRHLEKHLHLKVPGHEMISEAALRTAIVEAANDALGGLMGLRYLTERSLSFTRDLGRRAREIEDPTAGERQLSLSSRFAPLTASHLASFGAFLDEPLREYDYYAGVYDAMHSIAQSMCTIFPPSSERPRPRRKLDFPTELDVSAEATQRCFGSQLRFIAQLLRLGRSDKARQVISALARDELAIARGGEGLADDMIANSPEWQWLATFTPQRADPRLGAILSALRSNRVPCKNMDYEAICYGQVPFPTFIRELRANGYVPREVTMREILERDESRWPELVQRVLDRSLEVGLQENQGSELRGPVLLGHSVGELLLRRRERTHDTVELLPDPSSLPPLGTKLGDKSVALAHLMPYRVALDVARGGVALAWLEPALLFPYGLSIQSTVEPFEYDGGRKRFLSNAGLRPTVQWGPISIGAGGRVGWDWTDQRVRLGADARVGMFQDRIGLVFGTRDVRDAFSRSWFLQLAISDLNGALYWLSPWR